MAQLDDVTGALESLAQVLEQHEQLPVVLQRCCQQVVHAIPAGDLASVTLLRPDGSGYTIAATGELATDLDEVQYAHQRGPCLPAAETGQLVRASLTELRAQWPAFVQAAIEAGIVSTLSAPLFIDRVYHGSLNLYGGHEHGYRDLDAAMVEVYVTAAEVACVPTSVTWPPGSPQPGWSGH